MARATTATPTSAAAAASNANAALAALATTSTPASAISSAASTSSASSATHDTSCKSQPFCGYLRLSCCGTDAGCCVPDADGMMLTCCIANTTAVPTTTEVAATTEPPVTIEVTLNTTLPVANKTNFSTTEPTILEPTLFVPVSTLNASSASSAGVRSVGDDQEPPYYEKAWFISAIIVGLFLLVTIFHYYCCRRRSACECDSPGTPEIDRMGAPPCRRYARHKTMFQTACERQGIQQDRVEPWWQANLNNLNVPKPYGSNNNSIPPTIVLTPPVSQNTRRNLHPLRDDLMFNYSVLSTTSSRNSQPGCGAQLSMSTASYDL